jgi:hypothetical protein
MAGSQMIYTISEVGVKTSTTVRSEITQSHCVQVITNVWLLIVKQKNVK